MRTTSLPYRSIVSALLGTGFIACDSPTSVRDQLDVTLSVDRSVIATGQPATVTVVVRNRGRITAEIAPPQAYSCYPPYMVHDDRDAPIMLPGRYCLAVAYAPYALGPGDSVVIRDQWSGDMSTGTGAGAVTPGQYRVRARIMAEADVVTSAAATTVSVVRATSP